MRLVALGLARVVDSLNVVLMWLAGLSVALMMLNISLDIASKYLLHSPIHATLEITTFYYMPFVALAPIAYIQRRRGHIMVELFTGAMPPRRQALLDAWMDVLGLVYFALIGWYAALEAARKTARNEYVFVTFFDLTVWPARWIVPLVAAAMVLCLTAQLLDDVAFALRGRRLLPAPAADAPAH